MIASTLAQCVRSQQCSISSGDSAYRCNVPGCAAAWPREQREAAYQLLILSEAGTLAW